MESGLLSGLAEGIKSGLMTYNETKDRVNKEQQYADERKMRNKMYNLNLAEHGLMESADDGYIKTPEQLEKEKRDQAFGKSKELRESREKGLLPDTTGDYGEATSYKYDPEYIKMIKGKGSETDSLASLMKQQQYQKMLDDAEKRKFEQSPKGKYEKLPDTTKGKVGNYLSVLNSLTQYEDQYDKGARRGRVNPDTPILGGLISASPIDQATTKISDDIGRLRSGGAISIDEENRFQRMLPKPADSKDAAKLKLKNLRREIEIKMQSAGVETGSLKDLGYEPSEYGYEKGMLSATPDASSIKMPDFDSMSDEQLMEYTKTKKLPMGNNLNARR